jgi:tetratricopeptide (TPR) repeat protein
MNRSLLIAMLAVWPFMAEAQQLPIASPRARVEQQIGITKVVVDYGRPSRKDRRVFGDLVQFDELWRTGANKCTTVELDRAVRIEDQELPAGKYALLSIPGRGRWTIIFNSNTELAGTDGYDERQNVLLLKVAVESTPVARETLTIGFDDLAGDNAVMFLEWEKVRVNMRINADATEQGIINIKEAVNRKNADYRTYHSSARFYLDRGLGPEQALEWAQKSVSMEKRYWNLHTLALCLAENGRYADAIRTAEESMELARQAKDNGYASMNKEKIEMWMQKR